MVKPQIMKEHYLNLWKYNDWSNRKVLDVVASSEIKNEKVILLMSHVLSAQFIWHLRIVEKSTSAFPVWEKYKLRELYSMNEDSTLNWLKILDENEELSNQCTYKNSKGDTYTSSLIDIMTHVINHGTHHRAQISTLLKQEGIQPPALDYIVQSRS